MATEPVRYLIDAKDESARGVNSAKKNLKGLRDQKRQFARDTKQATRDIGHFGQGAESAAKSTKDLVGTMAGGQVAFFGDMAEKAFQQINQLKDGTNKSSAAMLGMKAGVVAASAVIVARISTWAFGLDKYNKKIDEAIEKSKKLGEETSRAFDRSNSMSQFRLGLIDDPEKKLEKLNQLIATSKRNVSSVKSQVRSAKDEFDRANNSYLAWVNSATFGVIGDFGKETELAKHELDETETRLKRHRSLYQNLIDQRKQMIALQKKQQDSEKKRVETQIKGLKDELFLLGKSEKERRLFEFEKMKGVTTEQIKQYSSLLDQITRKQKRLEEIKGLKFVEIKDERGGDEKRKLTTNVANNAIQSRLLTRGGPHLEPMKLVADNTKLIALRLRDIGQFVEGVHRVINDRDSDHVEIRDR